MTIRKSPFWHCTIPNGRTGRLEWVAVEAQALRPRLLIQLLHVNLLQICCSCSKMKYLMHVPVAGCGTGCNSFLRSAIRRSLTRIKSQRWPGEVTTGG